jgi:hypothetical protein
MPWVTDEQLTLAREVDLLTYLRNKEPHELIPDEPGVFRTATHGSLVISNGKWIWNRRKFGGTSALDYLVDVRGMNLPDAVEVVLGSRTAGASSPLPGENPKQKKHTFYPPKPTRFSNLAVSYLQKRGISPEIIRRAMQIGIFYESRYYNPKSKYHNAAVCVFAGKNESGKTVFAALRGIDVDMKQDKAGSDKRFNFHIPAKDPVSRHLAVFEAPLDALSHATLQYRGGWKWSGHRLSLGGTSSVALTAFLERNPQIRRVSLHLDNDPAGLTAARKIKSQLAADSRFKRIKVSISPPRGAKDYNDLLLRAINLEREQKQPNRRKAAILL